MINNDDKSYKDIIPAPNPNWQSKYTPPRLFVSDNTRGKGKTKLPDFNKIARKTLILAGEEMERILKLSENAQTLDQKSVERLMDLQKLTTSILKEKTYVLDNKKPKPKTTDIIDETPTNDDKNNDIIT